LFGFDENNNRMVLLEVAKRKKPEDIQEKVSFELLISPGLKEMEEPTEEDLRLLREVCDPEGYFLGREIK
jgi:glutaconate CoA-transferase subunit B